MLLAYRSRPVFVPTAGPNDPVARYRTTVMTRMRAFGLGIPIVLGLLSGLVAQASWVTVQMFMNGGSFGKATRSSVSTSGSMRSTCRSTGSC